MTAPTPGPAAGTGARGGTATAVDLRSLLLFAAVAVVAALALAFVVLREIDLRDGPPIVIEDPLADATIVVAVGGEVAMPGVYDFPHGARVDDALARAGGELPDADLSNLNLARRLDDGEQLTIPRVQPTPIPPLPGAPTPTTPPVVPVEHAGAASHDRPININTATASELETLPEIGETRAAAIVAYREANGPFASVDELINVTGISERIVEILRPYVTVGP